MKTFHEQINVVKIGESHSGRWALPRYLNKASHRKITVRLSVTRM